MRIPLLLLLFLPLASRAAVDPEIKTPYSLKIVLRIAEHPHFTEHFRRQMPKELGDHLQAALGPLGSVEIVDPTSVMKADWPPLWKLADDKGLAGLDSYHDLGGGKTHFLNLDFADGQYILQSRQHDGSSGFVSPLVREVRTRDRAQIERLASLMLGRDFGYVATLEPGGNGDNYFLKAKAGGLGPIDKWVKKGDIFAVVGLRPERRRLPADPMTQTPAKTQIVQTGNRVDGVLLQVTGEPRDGLIPCKMYHRYEEPLPRGLVGFRAVKLGTVTAPLRLQLLDPAGQPHKAAAIQVHAHGSGYPEGDREADLLVLRGGAYTSTQPFENLAFVRVMLGNRRLARIPIEILDDRIETRQLRLDPTAELRDRLEAERRAMLVRLTDGRLIQVRCFQEITALEQQGKKPEALERGQGVLKLLDAVSVEIQDEIAKLDDRAQKELPKAEGFAKDCERQLQTLRAKQGELKKHLEDLTAAIADDANPLIQEKKKKVQDLIRSAELLVTQAEYDRALAVYQEAIAAAADEPAAMKRIEGAYAALKNAWNLKPGDMAHAAARKFITDVWPRLATPQDVRNNLLPARQAFEKSKAVGDRLGIAKMQMSSVEVASRYADELKKLADNAMSEEDGKALEAYRKASDDLITLLREVQEFLQK